MELAGGKKVYFLSDFHLGTPDYETSLVREKNYCFLFTINKRYSS
jgi:UDP-2,3-diacylglucosamine hydrolase